MASKQQLQWASSSPPPSIDDSMSSSSSLSNSSDLGDDASSSSSSTNCNNSSSASSSSGPLYELADLMAQLPIKRGLSKFYNGKSQTFGSLSKVTSVEDLGKREMSYSRRMKMKSCKSYGENLNIHHQKFGPKATIAKRPTTKSSCASSFATKTSLFIHG